MPLIAINEALPGMIVKKPIESPFSGAILLNAGTILNNNNIFRIKDLGIKYIEVVEAKNSNNDYIIIDNNKYLATRNELVKETKKIFNQVRIGKKVIITEVSDTVNDLILEITKSNNILGKLRQIKDDDDYTYRHSINVCMLSTMIGKWLNYSAADLKQLSYAGLFHDIGKYKIPDNIIKKPAKLTPEEYNKVKKHTIFGYRILNETVGLSKTVSLGALQHHEREDGSGYPFGIKSEKIHEFAKIIAVCDVFDAMTSDRIYKRKISSFSVAEYIADNSFGALDPKISRLFLDNISKFYVGNIVKLNTGEIGRVIYVHKEMPTRPVVKVDEKYVDLYKDSSIKITEVIN